MLCHSYHIQQMSDNDISLGTQVFSVAHMIEYECSEVENDIYGVVYDES